MAAYDPFWGRPDRRERSKVGVRLNLPVRLARRYGAHLAGTYVVDIPPPELFFGATPYMGSPPVQVIKRVYEDAVAAAAQVEAAFRERLQREAVEGEWRLVEGNLPATVALHARYADLAIIGQPAPEEPSDYRHQEGTPAATIMTSGRPVLAVLVAGYFPTVG